MIFNTQVIFSMRVPICKYIFNTSTHTCIRASKQTHVRLLHSTRSCQNQNSATALDKYYSVIPMTFSTKTLDKIGLNINVCDVKPDLPAEGAPVVVALHGVPGGAEDFHSLSFELKNQGVRFLTLEFPGIGRNRLRGMDIYRLDHSTEGKFIMLKEMLHTLNIKRIDVLLSHSAGTWLGYKAGAELDMVKSAIILNTLGRRPHRSCRPWWSMKIFSASLRSPLLHNLLYRLLPVIYKVVGFNLDDSMHPTLPVAVETVRTANFDLMSSYAEKLASRNIPLTVAISKSDKIVEWSIGMEMVNILGISEKETIKYDKDNQPDSELNHYSESRYKRLLLFERGGHVIQIAHKNEIVRHILQLIDLTRKQ